MDSINNVSAIAKNNLNIILKNPYIMAILKVSLILYAAQIAPKLPSSISKIFEYTFVKIFFIILIAYLAEVDFQLAILLAVVFVLSANLLSGRKLLESYNNLQGPYYSDQSKYNTLLGTPVVVGHAQLLDSSSDNYPGCNKITINDLIGLFDGDHMKLQTTVKYAINGLMHQLPDKSDAKNKLLVIAHAVGLPYNVELNDQTAPYIATLLLNYGFKVSDECQAPH